MSVVTFSVETILAEIIMFAIPAFIPGPSNGVDPAAIAADPVMRARYQLHFRN